VEVEVDLDLPFLLVEMVLLAVMDCREEPEALEDLTEAELEVVEEEMVQGREVIENHLGE
jgi:hypothetical protein